MNTGQGKRKAALLADGERCVRFWDALERMGDGMSELRPEDVGYYTDASQSEPAYDPGDSAPCPVCGEPWTVETVRTYSVTPFAERFTSAFWRLHRACDDGLTDERRTAFDEQAMRLADEAARRRG